MRRGRGDDDLLAFGRFRFGRGIAAGGGGRVGPHPAPASRRCPSPKNCLVEGRGSLRSRLDQVCLHVTELAAGLGEACLAPTSAPRREGGAGVREADFGPWLPWIHPPVREGCAPGGPGLGRAGSLARHRPGAVDNSGIVAYRARSPFGRLSAQHAQTAVPCPAPGRRSRTTTVSACSGRCSSPATGTAATSPAGRCAGRPGRW
jgi:hypothetical protein